MLERERAAIMAVLSARDNVCLCATGCCGRRKRAEGGHWHRNCSQIHNDQLYKLNRSPAQAHSGKTNTLSASQIHSC
jgi:hypothetical protein